ncbi:sigma-70 family RNA polymerase sigma factor [Muricauda sp. CAU 1633]|uniref:RNA polymerase sigma factor n=1 Tax=Allomuricauda sp. CAU 1633 TaxID=2816036 RepID=UPI001A8CD27C|nr:sigma-70 family RNA polymerase sigma factor [Muricauda sp. CAU 1633]MBO0321532.1 sigma-70 family RNA polymerase sigma factor [Muricauda sp. CAU 1633]
MQEDVNQLVDNLFRTEYGKMVSYLTSKFGINFLEEAEDVVQDTLVTAYQNWTFNGVPENPQAWIFVVCKNKAINILKKKSKSVNIDNYQKYFSIPPVSTKLEQEIEDSMLRMIFNCSLVQIDDKSSIILILSTLCGFSRKEIAQALLIEEEAVKKRLYRAKKRIRETHLNFDLKKGVDLQDRLSVVCDTLYLLFNQGYNSSSQKELIRKDMCLEALRLTDLLLQSFPGEPKINALMSLMCFHIARFESRIDDRGAIVLLKNQNRDLWNKEMINGGLRYLSASASGEILSTFHIEAGIAAEHCLSDDFKSTNWLKISELYQLLYQYKPSPIILLNQAIVKWQLGYQGEAIDDLNSLKEDDILNGYYLLHATLGEFYAVTGKPNLALESYVIAKNLTSSNLEKELIHRKMDSL